MKKDFWGQQLSVGDRVTYIDNHYKALHCGEIISLGKKMATIRTDEWQDNERYRERMGYGKTCRYYSCIVKGAPGAAISEDAKHQPDG